MSTRVGNTRFAMRTVSCAFVLALAGAALLAAQQPAPEKKTVDQMYKNIQVLHGMPVNQFLPAMRLFSAALGVDCEFCHVEADRSLDTIPMKLIARRMITMMFDLNKNSFGGGQAVTCYTCHRGNLTPVTLPALPAVERKELPPPMVPTADQILSKYIQAIGGEQAIRKVSSRLITAKQDIPTGAGGRIGVPAEVQRYEKAPNLQLTVYKTAKSTIAEGFDGTAAWAQGMNGAVNDLESPFQDRAKRTADFYEPLDLKARYSSLAVDTSIQKVNLRDAYLVIGFLKTDSPDRLYFDKETGLLLRKQTIVPTMVGDQPAEVDYDDYRATASGMKVPFRIHMVPASSGSALATESTVQIEKVEENVPIEDAKFARPPSKSPPPR